ncbi:MAG: hypothetical protein WBC06_15365 [Chitinophagaceae bacterium]
MFNFFKKKEPETKVIDKILMDESGKLKAMFDEWSKDKNIAFIFWFDESMRLAENYFSNQTSEPVTLLTTREAAMPQLNGKTPVFAEHYPLRTKEEELYQRMNLQTVQVFSSMREPLFQQFGGERIIQLMQKMGIKEDELIEHPLISGSIQKAQKKIEKKVLIEQTALSQADWFEKNYKS